jgi:hypothetical protein
VRTATYSPVTGEAFFRRSDRTAYAFGAGLAGNTVGARWIAYADRRMTDERQIADISTAPPTAFWRTTGWAAGAAAEKSWDDKNVAIRLDYVTQSGVTENGATQSSLTRAARFQASASQLLSAVDFHFHPVDSPWDVGARLSFDRHGHHATDDAARAFTDISAWLPGAGLALSRALTNRLRLVGGYGLKQYTPFATLPASIGRGRTYETLIAPAIEVAASTARAHRLELGVTWGVRSTRIGLRLWRATLGPVGILGPIPPTPTGSRTARGINVVLTQSR